MYNKELWNKYHSLQDEVEKLFREKNYKGAKKRCLDILQDVDALQKTGEFDDISKPFVDYAILMATEEELDEAEREILKILFSKKIITIKNVIGFSFNFKNILLAEQLFLFLSEINVLSKEEADSLIINARENDGEIVLPNPVADAALAALKQDLLTFLAKNQPMPQKDFVAAWRETKPFSRIGNTNGVSYALDDVFRSLVDEGKIKREKTGRSFTLFVNQ
jgi:hypothetical protein